MAFGDVVHQDFVLLFPPECNDERCRKTVSAYELPKSPVILVMDNGRIRKLNVEDFSSER